MTTAELEEIKTALTSAINRKCDLMRSSKMAVDEITRIEISAVVVAEIEKRKGAENGDI